MFQYDQTGMKLQSRERGEKFLQNEESLLCLGNGYLGVRACFEEDYVFQKRGAFIAGVFNKACDNEVSELPNCPDVTNLRLTLDGEDFSMSYGEIEAFERTLTLQNGELIRRVRWASPAGKRYELCFRRFVSLDNLHLIAAKVEITPLLGGCCVRMETGIDGTVTNTGAQHFKELNKRIFDGAVMSIDFETVESGVRLNAASAVLRDGKLQQAKFVNRRRSLWGGYTAEVEQGETVVFEKISLLHTSNDADSRGEIYEETFADRKMSAVLMHGYDELLLQSAGEWTRYWEDVKIETDGFSPEYRTILNACLYHMRIMTAFHDGRVSNAAKGLSGEGYKGHVFWDTEVFMLPHYLYTNPKVAKNLLLYRYERLQAARQNARRGGYLGAQFPWESAGTGAEETPDFSAINIHTGKPTAILSGKKEIHITADIAFMVWQYYLVTGDWRFMADFGCEMIIDCALFWCSRVTKTGRGYEILDVIGPDEYTESINNNTYTNTLVKENMAHALSSMKLLKEKAPGRYEELSKLLSFEEKRSLMEEIEKNIYLPPQKGLLIAQDDTFLSKKEIDLEKYRAAAGTQAILFDYSREEVIDMQILKQADVVMLLYLLPDLFSDEVKKANLSYYEAHTIHDSSLSKCIHGIVAMDIGNKEMAREFFNHAMHIDFGEACASVDGIHAASVYGVWNLLVRGMCGVSVDSEGVLRLKANLLPGIERVETTICYKGRKIDVKATKDGASAVLKQGAPVDILIYRDGGYQLTAI